jgi:Cdc6-like AAA superfamily ATPase
MDTMQSWFGLKEQHNDFSIETDADAAQFFARHELDEQLDAILRRSFRSGNPPKMVLYGDWGVGKTHTMRHLEHKIEHTEAYNARVVFVELPDITAKSTFQVAHAALLDALGLEVAKQWVLQFQTRHPSNAQELIRDFTQSGDISSAFANMLSFGEGSRIAWDWLRGISLSASDARLAGLPPSLSQSNHFVRVLQMLGRFSQEVESWFLVFMLDEAAKLGYVTNQDAVNHWVNAFKVLADQQTKEVGFVISGSWVDQDDMALPLQDQQVVTRFGEPNYIALHRLDEEDTRVFVSALLEEWIDPAKRESIMASHREDRGGEDVTPATFPFTKEGLHVAAQYACRQGGYTTPRDIQVALDDLLNRAIDDGRHIVSSTYIRTLVGA